VAALRALAAAESIAAASVAISSTVQAAAGVVLASITATLAIFMICNRNLMSDPQLTIAWRCALQQIKNVKYLNS
jgi:hypothetical protein